jgi:hypothetical protein
MHYEILIANGRTKHAPEGLRQCEIIVLQVAFDAPASLWLVLYQRANIYVMRLSLFCQRIH